MLAVAVALAPEVAIAGHCQNSCNVGDGDLCGEIPRVVPIGKPVRLYVTRQRGTCGGGEPMALADLVLTWSRTAAGPFTELPVEAKGTELSFTPEQPGPYFLSLAARDQRGEPDRLVVLAVDERDAAAAPVPVRFLLRPPRGLSLGRIALRVVYVPDQVDDTFPQARWPTWHDNDAPGKSGRTLRLPPGRYQLIWAHLHRQRPRRGVETVEVTGAGDVTVPLHLPAAPVK